MSENQSRRNPARRGNGSGDYEVGYGRPPKGRQFKPGQSGNPKGRPKGAENESTILRDILNRKITIGEGGRTKQVSVLKALLLKFTENALKGDPKTAAFILNRYRAFEATEGEVRGIDQDDQEVLATFARDVMARLAAKGKGDNS